MKRAFALLDLESVKREYETSEQQVKECLTKMHYRCIECMLVTETRWTPELQRWIKEKQLDRYVCLFRDDCISWINRLLKRYPPDWKLHLVESDLEMMDVDRERHGSDARDKLLFFDDDAAIRQAVSNLNDSRVQVCSSLQEVADSMDIPLEAFAESDEAIARLRTEMGLDDQPE